MKHEIDPRVIYLANKHEVLIENRLISQNHIFDGSTIGLWWYSKRQKKYLHLSDHDIIHEIAHYAVASPKQKHMIEYGLGTIGRFKQISVSPIIPMKESAIQERMVQLQTIIWGKELCINPSFSDEISFPRNWEEYDKEKQKEYQISNMMREIDLLAKRRLRHLFPNL